MRLKCIIPKGTYQTYKPNMQRLKSSPLLKITGGILLCIIGIIGLLVPIMPTGLFIFLGLSLIFPEKTELIKNKVTDKVKNLHKKIRNISKRS